LAKCLPAVDARRRHVRLALELELAELPKVQYPPQGWTLDPVECRRRATVV
jgi:hypothetical protein